MKPQFSDGPGMEIARLCDDGFNTFGTDKSDAKVGDEVDVDPFIAPMKGVGFANITSESKMSDLCHALIIVVPSLTCPP